MKSQILLLAVLIAVFSSCTTSYKTGQTPDDVYFSPSRPADEYVQTEKKDERRYQTRDEYYDDRYLRMRVTNRTRWSELDDYYYYGNRRDFSYYYNFNNPWTPASYWNCHYNPYYNSYVIVKPGSRPSAFNGPRTSNLNTYNNTSLTNNNYTNSHPGQGGIRPFGNSNSSSNNNYNNNSNSNRSVGNTLRDIFSNNNNNSSNRPNNNSSSNSNSSSSSSSSGSSGSSSGGSAPVRRF